MVAYLSATCVFVIDSAFPQCMTVAAEINGKTPDEIRRRFNLKNDLTPAEEEDVKRSNV